MSKLVWLLFWVVRVGTFVFKILTARSKFLHYIVVSWLKEYSTMKENKINIELVNYPAPIRANSPASNNKNHSHLFWLNRSRVWFCEDDEYQKPHTLRKWKKLGNLPNRTSFIFRLTINVYIFWWQEEGRRHWDN